MVLRQSDLSEEALLDGKWDTICECAGIEPDYDRDQEINIVRIEGEEE